MNMYKYSTYMHRTTILIPERLRREAEIYARRHGMTLSGLIRAKLKEAVRNQRGSRRKDHVFFSRESWNGSGPHDVAEQHDEYLYGKHSEFE